MLVPPIEKSSGQKHGSGMSWRCGLGTQVVFLYLATPFLSSFFGFDVLV
jgi:hypothetical protein